MAGGTFQIQTAMRSNHNQFPIRSSLNHNTGWAVANL